MTATALRPSTSGRYLREVLLDERVRVMLNRCSSGLYVGTAADRVADPEGVGRRRADRRQEIGVVVFSGVMGRSRLRASAKKAQRMHSVDQLGQRAGRR